MLLYMRHGSTVLNHPDRSKERLRGWLQVPLSPQGIQDAHNLASNLPGSLQADSFETSDLHRAMQTAVIVGQHLGLQPTPNPAIRDWNTGSLAGKLATEAMPLVKHLIQNPDEKAPGGESMNDYLDRFVPAMRAKIEGPGVHLVVGHARGAMVLQGIASRVGGIGGDVDKSYLLERPDVKPGGFLIINNRWGVKKVAEPDQDSTDN